MRPRVLAGPFSAVLVLVISAVGVGVVVEDSAGLTIVGLLYSRLPASPCNSYDASPPQVELQQITVTDPLPTMHPN